MDVDERTDDYQPAVTADEYATGEEVVGLIGLPKGQKRRMFALDHWVGVDEFTAVGFSVVEGVAIPVGLVHYAPITTTAVRDLKIGEMVKPEPWMPVFEQQQPPSPDQVRGQWWLATKRVTVTVHPPTVTAGATVHAPTAHGHLSLSGAAGGPSLRRTPGQDPDEFYAEVARMYRQFDRTTSKPTTSIATAAGVSRNTAAQWVHQARKRGHLEPAEGGK